MCRNFVRNSAMMMIMIIDLDFNVILWIRKNHVKYSKDSKDQTCSLGCFDATHIPIIPPDAVEFIKTETQNTQPWALYQLPAKISTLENFCISGMSSCININRVSTISWKSLLFQKLSWGEFFTEQFSRVSFFSRTYIENTR